MLLKIRQYEIISFKVTIGVNKTIDEEGQFEVKIKEPSDMCRFYFVNQSV